MIYLHRSHAEKEAKKGEYFFIYLMFFGLGACN